MKKILIICIIGFAMACNNTDDHNNHNAATSDTGSKHTNHSDTLHADNPMQKEMDKMMADMMALQLLADPDYDFALLMKAHHQAAVNMAQLQLQKGKDTAIRTFAEQVVADQSEEINQFNRILQNNKQRGSDEALSDSMMQAMHQYMEPHQPLNNDIDHDFLALMIPHHQSAVVMTEIYLRKGRDRDLRLLGNRIIKNQNIEIGQMKNWLLSK